LEPTLISVTGRDEVAFVYVLRFGRDEKYLVETVDSKDPRYPRREKSVIILSTQFGCPARCTMCDAGVAFYGNLSSDQILAQVRLVKERQPAVMETAKLKVHFARMGDPSLNPHVLTALRQLRDLVPIPGLVPSITSIAPAGRMPFFEELLRVRREAYSDHDFQLQLSVNTTDDTLRNQLIPVRLMDLRDMASYGVRFHQAGSRKVVLNFALADDFVVNARRLREIFTPDHFMAKITPINPTECAKEVGFRSMVDPNRPAAAQRLVEQLEHVGFETVVSIGDPDEIAIGSNCGQMVLNRRRIEERRQQMLRERREQFKRASTAEL
jgi:23S rRNA (adenine2503-C2)-methyltransferase